MPQNEEINALTAAVENAYSVFARYRPGSQLATCRCPQCMDDDTEQLLLKTPLREIDCHLLSEYTWSANGTNDPKYDDNELRYFLPRYFELIAADEQPCFGDPEPALRQLGTIGYRASWPGHEVEAIDRFFSALFRVTLAKPLLWHQTEFVGIVAISDVEDTMCVIAYGAGDMASLLSIWDSGEVPYANDHLACLANHCEKDDQTHGLWSAFWGGAIPHAKIVAAWIRRAETIARLQKALQTLVPGKEAELFEKAISVVERLIQKRDAD